LFLDPPGAMPMCAGTRLTRPKSPACESGRLSQDAATRSISWAGVYPKRISLPTLANTQVASESTRYSIPVATWTASSLTSSARGACAIRTADVDLDAGLVRVSKNWVELLESPEKYEKDPKSEAGKRTVNVPPHVLPLLRQHAADFAGPEFFCVGRDGKRMRGNTIYQAFVRARDRIDQTPLAGAGVEVQAAHACQMPPAPKLGPASSLTEITGEVRDPTALVGSSLTRRSVATCGV